METKFILDTKFKEEREIVAEILRVTEKDPYPDKETVHLAKFLDSCFFVFEEEKRKEVQKQLEEARKKFLREEEERKKARKLAREKELESVAPEPLEAPTPEALPPLMDIPLPPKLEKREYVLTIYDSPVGILIDKNENGKYVYQVIEPGLEREIQLKARELFGREFERDNSLFDDTEYLGKVAEKIAKKANVPFNDMLPQQVRYYLERDILGTGVFDPFLYDGKVKSIVCDGVNKSLRVEYNDLGMIETNVVIRNNEELNRLLKRIAFAIGKQLDERSPILDASFQGLKFEGVLGIGGTSSRLTIRRLSQ